MYGVCTYMDRHQIMDHETLIRVSSRESVWTFCRLRQSYWLAAQMDDMRLNWQIRSAVLPPKNSPSTILPNSSDFELHSMHTRLH